MNNFEQNEAMKCDKTIKVLLQGQQEGRDEEKA